jgi:predicted nucleic acid-binding protein
MALKIVIDTNVLVSALSSRSNYALKELPNVYFAHVYVRWNLIADPDDNKFVDCYVAAGANYLLSHDSHFSVLRQTTFPKVNVKGYVAIESILSAACQHS